jgi:hypothetical protein
MTHATNADEQKRPFYRAAANEAALIEARDLDGIDDEIALLRVRLRELLGGDENNENAELDPKKKEEFLVLCRGVSELVRAVQARYRMSPARADELRRNLVGTFDLIREQFFPDGSGFVLE